MTYPFPTAALILAAALAMASCGNAQEPESSSANEVPGLLEAPAGEAGEQPGAALMRSAHTNMARARGEMSVYIGLVEDKGSDAMKSEAAELDQQFKAGMKTARELALEMAQAEGEALPGVVERYNSNWKELQKALERAKELQMQALGAG